MLLLIKMGKGKGYYYINLAQQQGELDRTQPGEPPGVWWGKGSEYLGLSGAIHRADFLALFEGFSTDGEALAGNAGQEQRVPGWDATFSAVKSVGGILWAVTPPKIQAAIESCHERALRKALQMMEAECTSRYGDSGGLVFALFQHGSNRNGDPLLHTHVLVLNLVVSLDGSRYPAPLNSKPLYQWKKALGALYRAEFSHLLETELGLSLERVKQWFELQDFSRENGPYQALMNHWSSRRLEIEREGPVSAQQAQVLAQQTRQAKGEIPPRDVLFEQWREVAAEYGFTQQQAMQLIRPPRTRTVLGQKWAEWRTTREAVAAVVRHQSHFTRRDLIQAMAVAAQARQIASDVVLTLSGRYLASRHVMSLGRIDGEQRYANRRLYRLEQSLLATAQKLAQGRCYRIRQSSLDAAVTRHALTTEQAAAIATVTQPGRLSILTGITGTGKTYTLNALRDIYRQSGYQVLAVAPTRRQVEKLQAQTGIGQPLLLSQLWGDPASIMSVSGLIHAVERAKDSQWRYGSRSVVTSPLTHSTIVLVDDAQSISAAQMKRLLEIVKDVGAKVILTGDLMRSDSYEHQGALRALVQQCGQVSLESVMRQEEAWAQDIVQQAAQGKVQPVLQQLAEHQQFTSVMSRAEALTTAIEQWTETGLRFPKHHILLAETEEDVWRLNQLAQQVRIELGKVKAGKVTLKDQMLGNGDRVWFAESAPSYGITQGTLGTLVHLDTISRMAVVRLDTGGTRLVNTRFYRGLQLGYALTPLAAKDVTVRQATVLMQGIGRESTLIQLSRATHKTHVITYKQGAETEHLEALTKNMAWLKEREFAVIKQMQSMN